MQDSTTLGERLASVRKRRGLSQRELAKTSGVSLTVISKLEQGERSGVRVQTARNLAVALRVPTTVLLARGGCDDASPAPQSWGLAQRALAGQLPQPDEPATPEGVTAAMRDLAPALAGHQYAVAAEVLPALIRDADALGGGDREARQVHAEILSTTGYLLAQTHQATLAEDTLLRAIDVAGDRLDASAPADTLVWLYLRQGRLAEARETAARWADEMEPRFSRATAAELVAWGRFLLDITNAAVRDNRPGEADDALQLAAAAAARMGREVRRHPNSQGVFGPVTVAYIRAESAVLSGRPDRCLAIAESLPPRPPFPELVSRLRHKLDVANAQMMTRQYAEAVATVLEVRDRAPEWLAQQRYAKDIIGRMVQRRRTLTAEMRELADSIDLPL